MRLSAATLLLACALLAIAPPASAGVLTNGDFENWDSGNVCPGWHSYNQGTGWAFLQAMDTLAHSGLYAQKITRTTNNNANKGGIWQEVSATMGDAFTLADGWSYSVMDSTKAKVTIRADWDGGAGSGTGADAAAIMGTASQAVNTWYQWTGAPSGNALGASVTFYLDIRMVGGSASVTLDTTWDDISILQAFVPAAPIISGATVNSLNVDVDPGSNSGNADAQYALTIGGGAYALGTNWLQADGSVGGSPVWLTDAEWGTKSVGGLAGSTGYTFQAKTRYSATYTRETYLGTGALGTTVPEPSSVVSLLAGLSAVGFAIRRRRA